MAFIGALIAWLLNWWVWLPVVLTLVILSWQNNRKSRHALDTGYTLLMLEIPRTNDKKELAAEQMFAALHGILRPRVELIKEGLVQEHISFEIAAINNRIQFYVWTPKHLQNFVEGQIYAQYPTVQISEVDEDYASRDTKQPVSYVGEITLVSNDVLPIKTFQNFEVDPLAAITATLAKLEEEDEEMWIQVIARPIDDNWHKKGQRQIDRIKNGGFGSLFSGSGISAMIHAFGQFFEALWRPPEPGERRSANLELSERDKSRITGIEEKSKKLGYQVKIRIAYLGRDKPTAKLRMQAMVGTFKQFNTTNLNGFRLKYASFDRDKLSEYQARFFIDSGFILNIEELASIFHLPHTTVETPNIVWATAKTAEPPPNLAAIGSVPDQDLSLFGVTNFRGNNIQFGIKREDRGRHLYIIGQTGVGKSGLLELLTLSDIYHNQGFAVIDPHGDLAVDVLRFIPESRIGDVIYFNPADQDFPIGFNPLEVTDPNLKSHISSELVGVLKRMFDSWGPRLEYILRYTIMALLDYPGSTMLDITRMLTDKNFRNKVVRMVQDPVVRTFWIREFGAWNDKFAAEAVAPVLNKVGAFTANPLIRNIIGQPKSTFNIRKIMDESRILIVNLSRGLIGEDNAAILGAMMVTKIQLAAMSRADIPTLEHRTPFYLYVDEFQNFATDSFAVILSEARKYGLYLTVANQYVSQMSPEVRDAVFGNVGSLISFRVGPDDALVLQRHFEPQFDASDLTQMHNRNFVASLSIGGEKTPAFSGRTLALPTAKTNSFQTIVENSRIKYGRPRKEIELRIADATAELLEPSQDSKQKQNIKRIRRKSHGHQAKTAGTTRPGKSKSQTAPAVDKKYLAEDEIISLR